MDGFHDGGDHALKVNIADEIAPLLKDVFTILPVEKPRLYLGMCDPKMVLDLVSLGVDVFETSFASLGGSLKKNLFVKLPTCNIVELVKSSSSAKSVMSADVNRIFANEIWDGLGGVL